MMPQDVEKTRARAKTPTNEAWDRFTEAVKRVIGAPKEAVDTQIEHDRAVRKEKDRS